MFKVGDKVVFTTLGWNKITFCATSQKKFLYAIIKVIRADGNISWSAFDKNDEIYDHCSGHGIDVKDLVLFENNIKNNQSNNIMSKIVNFVKNSFLSREEKLLRKHGLKTDCGEYTQDAKDVVLSNLCKEKEADLVKIAEGLDEETKDN